MRTNATASFSLLRPAESGEQPPVGLGGNASVDLGLDEIAIALSMGPLYRESIKTALLSLSADEHVIRYRQEILADLLMTPEMVDGLHELMPLLARLHDSLMQQPVAGREPSLIETLGRLTELNTYVACVGKLQEILIAAGTSLRSTGLCGLRELLTETASDETYQSLAQNLPGLITRLNGAPSITIGINLDSELRPVELTLLSINKKPFKGGSLLEQLLGRRTSAKPDHGIAALHSVPFMMIREVRTSARVDPMMIPLFADVYKILRTVISPITAALKQYAQVNAQLLVALEAELAFYLGAARLIRKMEACGMPMCRPEILPRRERVCELRDSYNLFLAQDLQVERENLDGAIVSNDVSFGPDARIFILTGPNQGGKTVFTQAVGVTQLLFQAGLYVPARSARISPVDGIYTHFTSEEKSIQGMGRLSEESMRLGEIFRSVTPYSLVLLNESLSSTSSAESLYLAMDIVRALRLFGVCAIFATHLHELAEAAETINREVAGDSSVASLVAGVDLQDGQVDADNDLVPRTYKIKPGPPKGLSYAKGIAVRYGISFEQLSEKWRGRQNDLEASGHGS